MNQLWKKLNFVLLGIFLLATLQSRSMHEISQEILNNIYYASADYRFNKPDLGFTSAKKDVAYFLFSKNTLIIEEAALDVCRKMGKDSVNALAFIIGHELAHLYQEEMRTGDFASSFLRYDKGLHARIRYEKQADIQGAFNAYIAGYQIKNVIPPLIEELYRSYNLLTVLLDEYPTLIERKKTAVEVSAVIEDLILLFETAPYFSIIGAYYYAFLSYEYIGQYYRGGEVLNNLGLNYLLEGINLTDIRLDKFAFPIEFNWETRLKKPKVLYGAKDFDLASFTRRIQLLEKAKKSFEEAISQTKNNNTTASLNLATTLTLLGNNKEALDILLTTIWPDNQKNKVEILRSIILYDLDNSNKQKSLEILQRISKIGNIQEQNLSRVNIEIMTNENYTCSEEIFECNFIDNSYEASYPVGEGKEISFNSLSGTRLHYFSANGVVYIQARADNYPIIILNTINMDRPLALEKYKKQKSIYSFGKGLFAYCPLERQLIAIDGEGKMRRTISYKIGSN